MSIKQAPYFQLIEGFNIGGAHPGGLFLTHSIFKKLSLPRETNLLDIGCGTGQSCSYLYDQYQFQITGLDVNKRLLQTAKKRFLQNNQPIRSALGMVEKLPFQSEEFDVVLSESVLSFVDLKLAINEVWRVTKKGGRFVAIEMTCNKKLKEEEIKELRDFYGFSFINDKKSWVDFLQRGEFSSIEIWNPDEMKSKEDDDLTDLDFGSELIIQEDINDELFSILDRHEELTKKYANKISFYVYSAVK